MLSVDRSAKTKFSDNRHKSRRIFDFIKNLFFKTKINFLLYLIIHIVYFNFIFLGAMKGFFEYYYKKIKK